ncbi:MAG TPA: CarD family transcriptional regulator, partial [Rhodospirillaceae bacterium]|nr:CarD family transcriptional regulator [Rhodospirillaceae bacterium]
MAHNDNFDFSKGDYVVYPAHGVGQIEGIETQVIGGAKISLYTVTFEKERMRLKIPVMKAQSAGLRRLSTTDRLKDAITTLKGR